MKKLLLIITISFCVFACKVFQDTTIYKPIDASVKKDYELKVSILSDKSEVKVAAGEKVLVLAKTSKKYGKENKNVFIKIKTKENKTGWMPLPLLEIAYKEKESYKNIAPVKLLQKALNESIYKHNMKNLHKSIDRGAEPSYDNPSEYANLRTPLEQAVNVDFVKGFDYLLKFADKRAINKAFFLAVMGKNMGIMNKLLKSGAEINWRSPKSGRTPLLQVSGISYPKYPYLKIMKFLVDNGADINAVDKKGNSSLMYNILGERKKAIEYLLTKGIKTDTVNKKGKNVADFVKKTDNDEIKEIIKKARLK